MKPFSQPSTFSRKLLVISVLAQLLPSLGLAGLEMASAHHHRLGADVPAQVEAALSSCSASLAILSVIIILIEGIRLIKQKCPFRPAPLEEEQDTELGTETEPLDQEQWAAWRDTVSVSISSLTEAMEQLEL